MKKYRFLCLVMVMLLAMGSFSGCQSVSKNEKLYQSGLQLINMKSYPKAIFILSDLGDYKESKELVLKLRYIINGDYIGAGNFLVAALKSDGTVLQIGGYEDSKSTKDWEDIKTLSTHGEYVEGMSGDGKVVTTCPWTYEDLASSKVCSTGAMSSVVFETTKLEHVIAFQSNYPQNIIALLENGTVKVINTSMNERNIVTTKTWKDIVSVAEGGSYVVGLKADGSVVAAGENYEGNCNVNNWKDIVALSAAGNTVGLKEDGTVVATGGNLFRQCNVKEWTDIIAIATGVHHTVGLKDNGTVIATGDNSYGQCNTETWTDIVAIDASFYYTIGLKSNGTLLLAGDCSIGGAKTPNVENISGLFVPTIPKY